MGTQSQQWKNSEKDLFLRFLLQTGCVEGGEHVEKVTLIKPLLGTSLVGPVSNIWHFPCWGPRFDPSSEN